MTENTTQASEGEGEAQAKTSPEVEPTPSPAPAAPTAPQPEDWKDKRIAKLTAQLREKERALAAPPVAQPAAPRPGVVAMPGTPEFDALVEIESQKRVAVSVAANEFGKACAETGAEGRSQFQDWDQRVVALQQLVDPANGTEVQVFNNFLAAAMETGEGAKIIHSLGGDLNEAQRIMSLSPVKMGVALAKLAIGEGPSRDISAAPKPITTVGKNNSANANLRPDDPAGADRLTTAEWMARRNAQAAQAANR